MLSSCEVTWRAEGGPHNKPGAGLARTVNGGSLHFIHVKADIGIN